jgi:hypothetical protein
MHATPILSSRRPPASDKSVQSIFPTRAAASPQALGGLAAPNCGKQKKLSFVYDMRHNFASHRISILHDFIAENARTTALARAKAADAVRRGGNAPSCDFLAMLFGRNSRGEASLG